MAVIQTADRRFVFISPFQLRVPISVMTAAVFWRIKKKWANHCPYNGVTDINSGLSFILII